MCFAIVWQITRLQLVWVLAHAHTVRRFLVELREFLHGRRLPCKALGGPVLFASAF